MSSILVTGATGSFGRAFVKRLLRDPYWVRICVYSRGEHAQDDMRRELDDNPRLRWLIGDVRDGHRLTWAMAACQYVVHAAALKRIEVGAYNPLEMKKTNIDGAVNLIEAAHYAKPRKIVALSTDKAWQPISPYGLSKAYAESLFLQADYARPKDGTRFSVTRYGNVWWSAGSVGPKWKEMVDKGASELLVTDPECTRFFMTMDQAIDLVLHCLNTGLGGELMIPNDLPAYRLGDLVRAMGQYAKRELGMRVTGLPNHEKLHEGMLDGMTSDKAPRLTVEQLRGEIERVGSL